MSSQAVALRDLLGAASPWFAEMGTTLAAHDPDFLDAVLDRFDDTYAGLEATELLPHVACPVLLLQADPAAGGLLDDVGIGLPGGCSHGSRWLDSKGSGTVCSFRILVPSSGPLHRFSGR